MNTMLAAQMYTLREFLQTPEGIGRALAGKGTGNRV